MDLATLIGYLVGILGIVVGAVLEHTTLDSVIGPSAFLIVVVGSVGITLVSHSGPELKDFLQTSKYVFIKPKVDFMATVDALVEMAEKARKSGLLSLQDDAERAENLLIKRGLTMAVDGADQEKVRAMLEFMNQEEMEKFHHGSGVGATAAGYMPTIGIMGTVMGMTSVMKNLDKPETLGPSIAVAFLATLYGVGFANLFAAPFSSKIRSAMTYFEKYNKMVIAGILALQEGENPRNLREKLEVYVGHSTDKSGKAKGGE